MLALVILAGSIAPGNATLFTYACGILPWSLGANRAAVEAARDGELPKLFGTQTRWDTPMWAYVMMGLVASLMLLVAAASGRR